MKPTPLSSVLADDLLLDRIGARLDTDDELGSMLLAVAHRADTPIPRAIVGRRVRRHRGLTVLAALGVAVSGATVAAAVELGPVPPDQASGVPHSRSLLPQALQALVMPFLNGTPFQGRLVLPNGTLPAVPTRAVLTAAGLPGPVLPTAGRCAGRGRDAERRQAQLDRQDQQEAHQKTQAKGTTAGTGQGSQTPAPRATSRTTRRAGRAGRGRTEPKPPKPKPTSTPPSGARPTGHGAEGPTRATAPPTATPTDRQR